MAMVLPVGGANLQEGYAKKPYPLAEVLN